MRKIKPWREVQFTRRRSKEPLRKKVRKWKRHKKGRKGMRREQKKGKEWTRAKEEERSFLIKITEEGDIFAVDSVVMDPHAFSLLAVLQE